MRLKYIISVGVGVALIVTAYLFSSEWKSITLQNDSEVTVQQVSAKSPERPRKFMSSFQWANSDRQGYRLSIQSDVRLAMDGFPGHQVIKQRITGTLNMRVFDTTDEGIHTGFQLSPVSYSVNGETDQGMQDSLSAPFLVVFGEKGHPQSFHFPDQLNRTEQMILEEVIRAFQVILPDSDSSSWSITEEHATGKYLAYYQRQKDGSIQKHKTLYKELNIPVGGTESSDTARAKLKKSAMNIRLSTDTTWISKATLQEKMTITVGKKYLTDTTMKAALEINESKPDRDIVLFRNNSWEETLHAFARTAPQPDGANDREEVMTALSAPFPKDGIRGFVERLSSGEHGRIALLNELEQLIKERSEYVNEIMEYLRKSGNSHLAESALIHTLERAGTAPAQDGLVLIMSNPSYGFSNRLRAIIALGGVENPTDNAVTTLLYTGRNRGKGRDLDLANTALLSAGSIGSRLKLTDPLRADTIREELAIIIDSAEDANEAGMALKAMGNFGDPALIEKITQYINHDSPFVRASAAQTLGRIRAVETLTMLTVQLSVEDNAMVRSAIAESLENIGNPSYKSLDTVNTMVLDEPDSKTRYQMVRYLGDNVDIYPDGINTLKRLVMTDRSKQVRKYASMVLFKMRDQSSDSQRATDSYEGTSIYENSTVDQKAQLQTDLVPDDDIYQEEIAESHRYVSVARNNNTDSNNNGEMEIVLSLQVDDLPPNGLIVKEYIPKGWEVVESKPDYQQYDVASGEMKWLFVGSDVENMDISYKLVKKELSEEDYIIQGNFIYKDLNGEHISMHIDDVN